VTEEERSQTVKGQAELAIYFCPSPLTHFSRSGFNAPLQAMMLAATSRPPKAPLSQTALYAGDGGRAEGTRAFIESIEIAAGVSAAADLPVLVYEALQLFHLAGNQGGHGEPGKLRDRQLLVMVAQRARREASRDVREGRLRGDAV